jgi:hypothetical protein
MMVAAGYVAGTVYEDSIQAQTPGSRDVLVFQRQPSEAGRVGGILHFGFRLERAEDMPRAPTPVDPVG